MPLRHAPTLRCEKMSTAVKAFQTFDKDGSGSLTVHEIMDGLTAIGITYDPVVLQRMIENADLSYDGSIEYPEFIRFFIGKFVPADQLDEAQVRKDRALVLLRQLITAAFDQNDDGITSEELLMVPETSRKNLFCQRLKCGTYEELLVVS